MHVFSLRVLLVGASGGLLFALLDGLLFGSPLAQQMEQAFRPISRRRVIVPLGVAIDIVASIIMAFVFALFSPLLPAGAAAAGLAFGLIVWFFRFFMSVGSQAVLLDVPWPSHAYTLIAGLLQMMALGLFYGLALRPR